MEVSHILNPLNDDQRNAVASPANNLLVLAGAGSGKTRVLVHRIAWLIQAENISPFAILAVTFTNKAAREMRGRIEEILGQPSPPSKLRDSASLLAWSLSRWDPCRVPR